MTSVVELEGAEFSDVGTGGQGLGEIMPTNYYKPPQIFRPSNIPGIDMVTRRYGRLRRPTCYLTSFSIRIILIIILLGRD